MTNSNNIDPEKDDLEYGYLPDKMDDSKFPDKLDLERFNWQKNSWAIAQHCSDKLDLAKDEEVEL